MSRREDIDTSIWADPDFMDLSPHAKLVYVWSFTNDHCNMAGLYKVGLRTVAFETGLSARQVEVATAELQERRFMYYMAGAVWVRSRVKHLRTKHPNIAKSIANHVEKVGRDHELSQAFIATYGSEGWLKSNLANGSTEPSKEPLKKAA